MVLASVPFATAANLADYFPLGLGSSWTYQNVADHDDMYTISVFERFLFHNNPAVKFGKGIDDYAIGYNNGSSVNIYWGASGAISIGNFTDGTFFNLMEPTNFVLLRMYDNLNPALKSVYGVNDTNLVLWVTYDSSYPKNSQNSIVESNLGVSIPDYAVTGIEWYANGVGEIVNLDVDAETGNIGTRYELIDYNIVSEPSQFGTVGGKNIKLIQKDCDGNNVTFSLTGGGYGEVNSTDCAFSTINLFHTTVNSALTISTKGKVYTSAGSIICNGPIKSITAKTTELSGSITIGSSSNPEAAVTIVFDQANDLAINSQMPIQSISATEWLGGSINAPSVGSITIKGDTKREISGDLYDVNLILSQLPDVKIMALGSLTVNGWIDSSQIISQGNIGTVTAGAMINSVCFAGVSPAYLVDVNAADGVLDLPPVLDDTFNETATINSIAIKGIKSENPLYFINSNIAAKNVSSMYIAYPKYDNAGIRLVSVCITTPPKHSQLRMPTEHIHGRVIISAQQSIGSLETVVICKSAEISRAGKHPMN